MSLPPLRPEPRRNVYEAPFWSFVQEHDLRLQRCTQCATYRYPPGPTCPHCLSPDYDWIPLSGRGRLISWVVFHRQYFPELPVPYHVAAVETAEGPILLANLVNLGDRPLSLDLPMKLVYETARNTTGDRWEIYQWELA
jgi:uncharacterized OB-fold protein